MHSTVPGAVLEGVAAAHAVRGVARVDPSRPSRFRTRPVWGACPRAHEIWLDEVLEAGHGMPQRVTIGQRRKRICSRKPWRAWTCSTPAVSSGPWSSQTSQGRPYRKRGWRFTDQQWPEHDHQQVLAERSRCDPEGWDSCSVTGVPREVWGQGTHSQTRQENDTEHLWGFL